MYIKVIHKILIYSWIFCHISLKNSRKHFKSVHVYAWWTEEALCKNLEVCEWFMTDKFKL